MARVLILRADEDIAATAKRLISAGHVPLSLPLQAIVPLETLPPAVESGCFAVTSRHAVPALAQHFGGDTRTIYAVGAATAERLQAAGFADVRPGPGDAAALAETLIDAGEKGPILYVAGRERTGRLEAALDHAGIAWTLWEVYETRPLQPCRDAVAAALRDGPPDAVMILSAAQAVAYGRLAAAMPDLLPQATPLLCLSERIAAALPPPFRGAAAISGRMELGALFERLSET
ncbi:uroporphyrinogen-III synthase [Mangrovicella endophytica]|uniref:uroporphyrinogen-III synthase n=1 Tax=Mangrovicella endophytica TaxID=2066697 RepID=UPI000C9EA88D|nr:uroporphyrinogen-III synthase [Mangrovicella endophytica]